ncbi:MAG: DUF2189 domain-containing protein [Caulobacteraceae bacterium]|nr:DUF2189 domain-containing protein [Caulobacter sp.]
MSVVTPAALETDPAAPSPVRAVSAEDLRWALARGWDDFNAKRGEILMLALIYPVVGLVACAAVFNADAFALAFPLAAGLSLMGPALASGFYEIARLREAGEPATWRHFFDPWRGRSGVSLALMTLGLAVVFALWVAAAWAIYAALFPGQPYVGVADFLQRVFSTPQGWALIAVGNVVGAAFALFVLAASAVSFPMLIDRPVDAAAAVRTSFAAVGRNPATFLRWGLIVGALLVAGAIPLFVGLAIVLPVLGYATWHLYTRAVVRP